MGALRKIFGPSKAEMWRQVSEQIGATFDEGGFLKSDTVKATDGEWTITLDVYVVSTGSSAIPYTRLRAPYVNPDGFRFNVYRKSIFTPLGKLLGMQDVEVGYAEFDEAFVIQGTDETKLRALFANATIRSLIEAQKAISFSVKDSEGWFGTKFPENVDELHFVTGGIIKDPERLKLLFDLFSETLDELCRIGSAYEEHPQVTL
jgi:hypothetical protein